MDRADTCGSNARDLHKILSIRTITSLLEILHDALQVDAEQTSESISQFRQQIPRNDRCLSALATLLVRNNETVAVMTKNPSMPDSPITEIVICSHDRTPVTVDPPSNLRKFESEPEAPHFLPLEPSDIDPFDVIPYLKRTWTSQSFSSHAAALLRLLSITEQSDGDKLGILSYVVAASRQKIFNDLERDHHHPKSFFGDLLNIPPSRAKQSARPFPNHQSFAERDADFLEALSSPLNESFFEFSTIGISTLMEKAKAYKRGMSIPMVYTNETCEDIHRVLCHILCCYEASLITLNDIEVLPSTDKLDGLNLTVYIMAKCGLILWALAHSSFIDEHMHRIQIPDRFGPPRDVQNSEFNPIRTSSRYDVECNAADWLRSLVEHFEAVKELFEMAPHIRGVSTEIVTIPHCGTSMLPWKEVVEEVIASRAIDFSSYSAQDAIKAIEELASRNVNLDKRLNGDMLFGQNFRGTVHVQTCLASAIQFSNSHESHNLSELCHAFGMSEPCCHVCTHLTSQLGAPELAMGQPIVACSIPSWLPLPILDEMISHLMRIVLKLCSDDRSKLHQDPTVSPKSDALQGRSTVLSAISDPLRPLR